MPNEQKKKPAPKYLLPSQRIINMVKEMSTTETPMGAVDISIMTSFAILDKIEELILTLRSFRPAPEPVKPEEVKKNDA